MIFQTVIIPEMVAQKGLFTDIIIANANFSSVYNDHCIDLGGAVLYLQGPITFDNNNCNGSIIHLHECIIAFTNYVTFLANKAKAIVSYHTKKYYYLILTENSTLNVSYNRFMYFTYTIKLLPKIPDCYFSILVAGSCTPNMEIIQLYFRKTVRSLFRMHIIICPLFTVVGCWSLHIKLHCSLK